MDIFEEGVRTGYEPSKGGYRVGYSGFEFDKYKKGQKVDPKFLAAYNLNKTLEKYPEFTKEARTEIQNEFTDFPDLAVMNLETLASVLFFLKYHPKPVPKDFSDENIVEYFSRLIPDKITSTEKERYIIRLKAQFLKYIRAINTYRSSLEFEEEEEQEEQPSQYGEEQYEEDE